MHLFFVVSEAFGHHGGIGKFNRDVCAAVTADPLAGRVTACPRVPLDEPVEKVPNRVNYRANTAGWKGRYTWRTLRSAITVQSSIDMVICGHINLLPVAVPVAWGHGVPLLLILHGIDAWTPHASPIVRWGLSRVNAFVSVSQYTKDRFLNWAPLSSEQGHVIPNCINASKYGPGPKRQDLLDRYGLRGRTILLTLGRLSSEEQYKGHDEILELLPELARESPDVAYLICGDGDDRPRLERKAEQLGISDRVVFAGYVPEREKADHYRLADAFVMPGRGEGFGIVYLEAMACGVPVVASQADASREAVRNGTLGAVVDPDEPSDIKRGIYEALDEERGVPDGLEYFSHEAFQNRWQHLLPRFARGRQLAS